MANINVLNMAGEVIATMDLSDAIFGAAVNEAVLHAAVRAYLLNQRQGTQSTLTRSEVSGGGRKPWRQKGTGRARQGSTRSPQWTHGGVALGPKPRSYRTGLNKKQKRVALISALSDKYQNGKLIVLDDIQIEEYKTKTMVNMLTAIGAGKKPLVVLQKFDNVDENTMPYNVYAVKSCANIAGVKTTLNTTLNVYDILNADTLVTTVAVIKKLEEVYA